MKKTVFPIETIAAIFPPAVRVGMVKLYPLTLRHVAALAVFGIDATAHITGDEVYTAAWILSHENIDVDFSDAESAEKSMIRFFAKVTTADLQEMQKGVNGIISASFSTFIPSSDKTNNLMKTGNGWILEIAEALMSEYGWTLQDALDVPVSTAFALAATARIRNGGENSAPSYWERLEIGRLKEAVTKAKKPQTEDSKE